MVHKSLPKNDAEISLLEHVDLLFLFIFCQINTPDFISFTADIYIYWVILLILCSAVIALDLGNFIKSSNVTN